MTQEYLSSGKRPSQPNYQEHKKSVDKITAEIDILKKEVEKLKEQIANSGSGNSATAAQRKELKAQIEKLKAEQSSHWETRKRLLDRLKQAQSDWKRKSEDLKTSKERLSFKSYNEIDRRISELEIKVASGTMKLIEEKRVLADISALRKQRKLLDSFGPAEETLEKDKLTADEIKKELDSLEPETKSYKQKMDAVFNELRALEADNKDSQSKMKSLFSKRDELNAKINELFQQRKELHAEFTKKKEEWIVFQQEESARRALQYQEEREERDKQRKLNEIQKMKENAEVPAFQDDINSCNALIGLLQGFLPSSNGVLKNNSAVSSTNSKEIRAVSDKDTNLPKGIAGTVALKKKSDRMENETYLGGTGGKKKNANQKPKEKDIKFDLNVMEQFMKFKIDIPSNHSELSKAIEALTKKKEYFLEHQEQTTKENIEKANRIEAEFLKEIEEKEAAKIKAEEEYYEEEGEFEEEHREGEAQNLETEE